MPYYDPGKPKYRYGMTGYAYDMGIPVPAQFLPDKDKYNQPTTRDLGGAPTMGELYKTSMANMDALRDDVMGDLRGYGNAQKQRLDLVYGQGQYGNRQGSAMGQALQRNPNLLSSTSIGYGMKSLYDREYSMALSQLGEQLSMQKAKTQMSLGLSQEQQRAQLGTAANQQAYNYDVLQQRENTAAAQMTLGLGGLQAQNAANAQRYALGIAGLAQQANAAQGGGGGGYGDPLAGVYPPSPSYYNSGYSAPQQVGTSQLYTAPYTS